MVLHAFGQAGAQIVFGLPGTHNLAFWRPSPGLATPRLVNVRHEQTAVYAADGWARSTGRLGAAVVTTGPGAANTLAAFGEASMSGSPLVLVASEVPLQVTEAGLRRTLHQSKDQAAMFGPLAKAVFTPRSAQQVVQDIGTAVATALRPPRGPVYMDVPADVLRATAVSAPALVPPAPGVVDEAALAAAARVVNSAGPVAIWAGGGVVDAEAAGDLARLAAHLQAPVFTTFSSRGLLSPADPANVGLPPHEPEIERLLGSAEVLIALGTDFDGMMTKDARLTLPPTIVDVNVDLGRTSFGYGGVVPVLGDAKCALEFLLKATDRRQEGLIARAGEIKAAVWSRLGSDPRTSDACTFVECIERTAAGTAVVVNDMTVPGYWLGSYYQPHQGRTVQYPVGWGTLGYALPASVGAAFGSDGPVLAVCGDGGFMLAVGELATIAQERLPVTVLLVNDGGYGMLRYDPRHTGEPQPGADLAGPDFVQLAAAFGIPATHVTGVGLPLERALGHALASYEPQMVVCDASLFPPKTTSPRWPESG